MAKSKPIKNDPITNYKWPDKGRKNKGIAGSGPIKGSPVEEYKGPDMGRKN